MIISLRKWIKVGKFFVIFVFFTYVIVHLYSMLSAWIEPADKYKEPFGRAVKVSVPEDSTVGMMKERLRFFYWYGE